MHLSKQHFYLSSPLNFSEGKWHLKKYVSSMKYWLRTSTIGLQNFSVFGEPRGKVGLDVFRAES
jgi:hypothetical protein